MFHAQFVQALLACEAARQGPFDTREEEEALEHVLVLGDQYGCLLVRGDEDGGTADAAADAQQAFHQVVGILGAGGRPDEGAS